MIKEKNQQLTFTAPDFHNLGERYLTSLFTFWPNLASWAGVHEYDHKQPDLRGAAIKVRVEEVQAFSDELAQIDVKALNTDEAFDYRLLRSALDLEIYQWTVEREWTRNPLFYLRALDTIHFLKRNYAPLEERVRAAIGYLQNTPRVLDAARENLMPNPPRPYMTVAIVSYEGMLSFYDKDLEEIVTALGNSPVRAEVEAARQTARSAVETFIADLREKYLPNASEEYAIGAENFSRMLRAGELVDMPLAEILAVGERDLGRNLNRAREVARQIDPTRTPAQVADTLKQEHPTAEALIPFTQSMLEELRQYLIDHHVITIPSQVRATVTETPAFFRWAFAAMDTPGPFEKVANEAYYYVTPPEKEWTVEKQEEWLSSFNVYELQATSIHEAYPGHYVHFLHVNYNARGNLRQLLYSYAFAEGWAHYAEEMMLEVGYGNGDPKLHLAQVMAALLRDCRYVCAIKMHTQGMTVDEATKFIMENAFMEETPARKEAERGTFDPGYLNYTLGKLMILKLRADLQKRDGANFNLKKFHDELLAYGAPPVPLVRAAMLGEGHGTII